MNQYKTFAYKGSAQALFSGFKDGSLPFLLESSRNIGGMGRYSFFGSDPFMVLTAEGASCVLACAGRRERLDRAPLAVLRDLLDRCAFDKGAKVPVPFSGGAVGFFSYDFGFSLERIETRKAARGGLPELMFGFYDVVVCLDHLKNEVTVFSSGLPEKGGLRQKRAKARLAEVLARLKRAWVEKPRLKNRGGLPGPLGLSSNFSKQDYLSAIVRALDYIARGDIYQVNLSREFSASLDIDDWLLYRRLVKRFPVSFSAFFRAGEFSILSASPERFLKYDGSVVLTRPMKGTRRRAGRPGADSRFKNELFYSPKEQAELLMVVDLERNDLGRVCDYGSVKVKTLRNIEAYSGVFQATAEIEGRLHKDKDRLSLLAACFPGGSVTGCPKIRAMNIIEELEEHRRGIYTGALGYLSFHNTLEFNILIRSFLKKGREVSFGAGGGIVADSRPEAEYAETQLKARALIAALKGE